MVNISRNEVTAIEYVGTVGSRKAVYTHGTVDNSVENFFVTDIIATNYGTVNELKLFSSSTGYGNDTHINLPANTTVVINKVLPKKFIIGGTTGAIQYVYASVDNDVSGRFPRIDITGYP